jgi:hypothetical protein
VGDQMGIPDTVVFPILWLIPRAFAREEGNYHA